MKSISSTKNPLVKEISLLHSKKGRDKLNLFLIEGTKNVEEAIKDKIKIKLIAFREGFKPPIPLLNYADDYFILSQSCFEKVSTTDSPGNVIAIAEKFSFTADNVFKSKPSNKLILILDDIKDPGNLGTIIRAACGAGVDAIFLTDLSVDIFNSKVIRSTAGALWKIPVVYFENRQQLIKLLKDNDFLIYSTQMTGGKEYYSVSYNNNIAIIFGSEATGVSDLFQKSADELIFISISDRVESLNVASSASIILFEAARQKKVSNS